MRRRYAVLGLTLMVEVMLSACSAVRGTTALVPAPGPAAAAQGHAATACKGVGVAPSTDRAVQRILDAHPGGTTFCFAAGTYRFANYINPKAGQRLIGTGTGTILTGAIVISGFQRTGAAYRAHAYLQRSVPSSDNCLVPGSLCNTTQDVFFDGRLLARATSVAAVKPGTYYEDFGAGDVYIGSNPKGHLVEQAYAPAIVASSSGGVIVEGFVIEMAASPAQHGGIITGYRGSGWTIEHNEVRFNHGAGITIAPVDDSQGGSTIQNNFIHDNGQEGIGAIGRGLTVKSNEISYNNRANYACGWECGGAKFAGGQGTETQDLTVIDNFVHDNIGPGFWTDIDSYNLVFKGNRILHNRQTSPNGYQTGAGIMLEISDRAVIDHNVLQDNGPVANSVSQATFYQGGQIELSATPNVTVEHNTVSGATGIGMLQQDRNGPCAFGKRGSPNFPDGTPLCPYHYHYCTKTGKCVDNYTHLVHDIRITGNHIVETAQSGNADVAGLDCDLQHNVAVFGSSIVYDDNAYELHAIGGYYFDWKNSVTTKAAWLASGQDAHSTFSAGP